jgi:CcmD family protein
MSYVISGYVITFVVLGGYGAYVIRRTQQLTKRKGDK